MTENDADDFPFNTDGSLSPEELEKLSKFVSRALKDIMSSMSPKPGDGPGPIGLNIRIDKQGVPIIERVKVPNAQAPKGPEPPYSNAQQPRPSTADANPLVDISETQKGMTVTMEMRGASKDSVAVSVSNRQIRVRSASNAGQTTQTVALPHGVNPQSAKAHYRNGVLEIRMGKSKTAPPNTIDISVE